MTELRTGRLSLRPMAEADAPFVLELLNDAGWIANIGDLGLSRIVAITAPGDAASQRVLEKLGFRYAQTVEIPGYDGPSAYFTS